MLPTFLLHIISAIMTFFQEALLLKGDPAMRSQAPAGADECAAYEKEKAMGEWQSHYERGAFLETGLAADESAADQARQESELRGWRFERVMSDLGLIERLLNGDWDADFLVVQPGQQVAMSYDDEIVKAITLTPEA